ncbi:hypothetical protein IFM47457_07549 [Aspergillus lentulus]|nr:hypothetical protein IFM47457_07549 [Aspergillus lentulus]
MKDDGHEDTRLEGTIIPRVGKTGPSDDLYLRVIYTQVKTSRYPRANHSRARAQNGASANSVRLAISP